MKEKEKQLVALQRQLSDYEVEFRKSGLAGVPPAVAFDHLVRHLQDCQGQVELLKCDLFEARMEWAELWRVTEEVTESSSSRIEMTVGAENSNEVAEIVPLGPELQNVPVEYESSIPQSESRELVPVPTVELMEGAQVELTGAYEETVSVLARAVAAEHRVEEVEGELAAARYVQSKLRDDLSKSAEASNIFKEAHEQMYTKWLQQKQHLESQARQIKKLEQKIEVLERSDSDIEDEIQRLLEEGESLKVTDGEESEGFKRLSKRVDHLLSLKQQIAEQKETYKSGPGSSSRQPPPPSKKSDSKKTLPPPDSSKHKKPPAPKKRK